jgi:Holliday junction resolvase RusA-like endonuclease
MTHSFTILGEPASKSNSRRLVRSGNHVRPIKGAKALKYASDVHQQAPQLMLEGSLKFSATLFYASLRPDLDASVLLDALQGKTYANDRQIKEIHLIHAIDRKNPRAEIVIERME